MSDIRELQREVAALRKQVAQATRNDQERDYEALARSLPVGACVTIPEGEALGGYTFQKMASGKLKPLLKVAGQVVKDGQHGYGRSHFQGDDIKAAADADPAVAAMRKRQADARKPYVKAKS